MIGVQLTHKIGFIGYRNHAKKLLDIVEENVGFEVSQIYHPSKNIDDSRITNNLKDLYECDGVFIASPNNTHSEYLEKIVENSNCLIYCEKPPVTSSKGIDYLQKLKYFLNLYHPFHQLNIFHQCVFLVLFCLCHIHPKYLLEHLHIHLRRQN